MKPSEHTQIIRDAIMAERSANPNESTFIIAARVMAAVERFLPPPDECDDEGAA